MNTPRTPRSGFGLARILAFCVGVPVMGLLVYWMMAPGHPPAPAVVDVQGAPLIEPVGPSPEDAVAGAVETAEADTENAVLAPPAEPALPGSAEEVASNDVAPSASPDVPSVLEAAPVEPEGAPLDGAVMASADRLVTGDSAALPSDLPAESNDGADAAFPEGPGPYAPAVPTSAALDPNVPRVVPDFSKRTPNDKGNLELTFTDLACYIYDYPDLETVEYDQDAADAAGSEGGDAMPPPPANDSGGRIPEAVMQLTGKSVELQGFMIPTEVEKGRIKGFILVKDQAGCCFGVMPMMNEWVHVTMEEGRTSEFLPDIPLKVTGVLDVGEEIQDGMVVSLYRLKGREVLALQAPASGPDFWGSNF